MVARCVRDAEVVGSNPATPTEDSRCSCRSGASAVGVEGLRIIAAPAARCGSRPGAARVRATHERMRGSGTCAPESFRGNVVADSQTHVRLMRHNRRRPRLIRRLGTRCVRESARVAGRWSTAGSCATPQRTSDGATGHFTKPGRRGPGHKNGHRNQRERGLRRTSMDGIMTLTWGYDSRCSCRSGTPAVGVLRAFVSRGPSPRRRRRSTG